MARRFPFRTAIAGLTALTIATPAVLPVGNVPAAVAQVRDDNTAANRLAFTERPATVDINTDANYTVRVPNADGGSVQFYLDNVAQGAPVKVVADHATKTIKPTSYLNHTVTARYVDSGGFNPRADVTTTFNTPFPEKANRKGNGGASDNEAQNNKYSSKINDKNGTTSNPVPVQPGADITVLGYMTMNSKSVVYDYGLNPAPGARYQSGKTLNPSSTKRKATGNWPDSGLAVNPGFFAIDINPGWTSLGYTGTLSVEGKFKAPTVPGVYFTEIASYKYRTNDTYFLHRLDDSVYRVEAPQLPIRNQRTATKIEFPANQTFVASQQGEIKANVTTPGAAGQVIFTSGGKEIGRAPVQNGVATAKVTFDAEGTPDVTAKFVPAKGTNWAESTTTGKVSVTKPAETTKTTLTLEGSPKTGNAGEELILKATVTPNTAGGKVQFYDITNGTEEPLSDPVDVTDGVAEERYTPATSGPKKIKAVFTPTEDTKFSGSNAEWEINVDKQSVELKLEGSPQAGTVGDEITLKATVDPTTPGTVQFYEVVDGNETPIGTPSEITATNSTASTTHTPTTSGNKTYKAVFTPTNSDVYAGDDDTWNVEVSKKKVTLTLDAEEDKKAGDPITVTATVAPNVPGTVEFFDNEVSIGTKDVDANGVAILEDTFADGSHPLKAVFTPTDSATYGSDPANHTLVVGKRARKDTETTVSVDNPEVTLGQSTTVTANVTKGVPGRVMFSDADGPLGWVEVKDGVATFTYTPRTTNPTKIQAEFIPTGGAVDTHNGSTGEAAVSVKDSPADAQATTLTLTGPTTGYAGENFTLTAVTSPKNATGTVTFFRGDNEIKSVDVNNGRATIELSETTGSYQYRAVFNPTGGSKFTGSDDVHSVKVEAKPKTTITASTTVTEPTTIRETETTTTTATSTEPTTVTATTTEPTTIRETETKTTVTTEPTTVTATTTEPTTVRETTTEKETVTTSVDKPTTVRETTTQPTTIRETETKTTVTTQPTTVRETETKTETKTTVTTQPTTVRETTTQPTTVRETETKTTVTTQPTTVTATTTEPTTVHETETKTETTVTTKPTTVTATTTEPTTVTATTTEPTTVHETETKTETTVTTQPTTVRETTTQPTTVRETETKTTVTTQPTTVTATTTEPTTVRETETKTETTVTTQPTTVRETTTQPTTVRETETKTTVTTQPTTVTATTTEPTTVRETETKTETTVSTQPTTVTATTTEPTTVRETETTVSTQPTTVTATTTEPTTVRETETKTETTVTTQPTTVRETTTEKDTVTTSVDKPTTVRETTTEKETVTTSVDKPTTVRETTTVTTSVDTPDDQRTPAAPAVDASKVKETQHGREITLTAGTAPGTKGKMIFELLDGTKLGEAPIGADGTARFTHVFDKPGVYEIHSYVLGDNGKKGEPSVPYTVTVAEKSKPGKSSQSSTGSSAESTDGSSGSSNGSKTGLYAGIGVIVTFLLGAIGFGILQHPTVRQFFASIGIRY